MSNRYLIRNDLPLFINEPPSSFYDEFSNIIMDYSLVSIEPTVIDVRQQIQVVEDAIKDVPFISIDKCYKPNFNVSRVFATDYQDRPIMMISDGYLKLKSLIPNNAPLILYDDDIATGNTIRYMKSMIHFYTDICPIEMFGNQLSGYLNYFDIIDLRDFFLYNSVSGLYVKKDGNVSRHSYVSDMVNLETRANLHNDVKPHLIKLKERYGL